MRRVILTIAAVAVVAAMSAPRAQATPTLCSVSLVVNCTGDGLTFLGDITTANQSNSTVASDVEAFLNSLGFTGPDTYLGREDGTGTIDGDSISITGAGTQSGTWTFSPGTTNAVASFIAIHAGNSQTEEVFEINSPGDSGSWATFNGHSVSNFDLFDAPASPVPEPTSLALLGSGLAALSIIRRRRRQA